MNQGTSWEAKTSSATQEISGILCNPKVHHRIHRSPPPTSILRQIDSVYAPTSHLSKTHFNIILLHTSGSSKWSHSLRFSHYNLHTPLFSPTPSTCPASFSHSYCSSEEKSWLGNCGKINHIKKWKLNENIPQEEKAARTLSREFISN